MGVLVLSNRKAEVRIDQIFTVDLYENDELVASIKLPNNSIHYAQDVAENWKEGLIKTSGATSETT